MQSSLSGIVDLDRSAATPLHRQLYERLKEAILSGRLAAGSRVPASRAMAAELGVARNTVLAAVEQLAAEGYLVARRGSATRIASLGQPVLGGDLPAGGSRPAGPPRLTRAAAALADISRSTAPDAPARPFRTGLPDIRAFEYGTWGRLLRRAAREMDADVGGYARASGHPRLRDAIVAHLAEARGVRAEPAQVIVTSSAQAALFLVALALVEPGDRVWLEDPGYLGARAVFAGAGAELVPIEVDGDGIAPPGQTGSPPRLIYVTPSHQFPTGALMSPARRMTVLEIAEAHGAFVIEDDYDSEFQYQGRPVAALQGLDRCDRVIYMGTFSKTMYPGLRIGFLVVPPAWGAAFERLQRNSGHLVAMVSQLALADFITEGHYRAHVRRMRTAYEGRRDALVALLRSSGRGLLDVVPPAGGMQLVARLAPGLDDAHLARCLAAAGVEANPLSRYYLGAPRERGMFLGFAAWTVEEIEARRAPLARSFGALGSSAVVLT